MLHTARAGPGRAQRPQSTGGARAAECWQRQGRVPSCRPTSEGPVGRDCLRHQPQADSKAWVGAVCTRPALTGLGRRAPSLGCPSQPAGEALRAPALLLAPCLGLALPTIHRQPRAGPYPLPFGFMSPSMKSTLAFLSLRLTLLTCGQGHQDSDGSEKWGLRRMLTGRATRWVSRHRPDSRPRRQPMPLLSSDPSKGGGWSSAQDSGSPCTHCCSPTGASVAPAHSPGSPAFTLGTSKGSSEGRDASPAQQRNRAQPTPGPPGDTQKQGQGHLLSCPGSCPASDQSAQQGPQEAPGGVVWRQEDPHTAPHSRVRDVGSGQPPPSLRPHSTQQTLLRALL